jgi:Class III cytochrome C family
MASSTYRRLVVALLLSGLLLASPPAASGGVIWDIGLVSGYVCVVFAILLYVYPLRGDGLPHSRLLGLSQHRRIGWWMLAAALTHVAVLLAAQPSIGRYLLPSAPIFMWFGVAALLSGATLVQTGLSARATMRRSESPVRSATLHIVLAAVMVFTLCAHVMGSGQWISGVSKTAAFCLLLALPLAWFAWRPRVLRPGRQGTGTAAGVSQNRLRRVLHICTVLLIPLLPSPLASRLLLQPAARPSSITVNFPHDSHTSVNCIACHHNFVDRTGVTGCVDCHRSQRVDLPSSSEALFHNFCRGCHTQLALEGARHGPTRACSACHTRGSAGH